MKKKKNTGVYVLIYLSMIFYIKQSNAQVQSVIASSGGHINGQNVFVSFTIGEPVIQTLKKPDMTVTQGFHQSTLTVTTIDILEELSVSIEAYPNPVTDELKLVVDKELLPEASYSLVDMWGGLVTQDMLEGSITKVSFQSLVPAVYFLKVNQGITTIKTFKIVKK